MKGAIFRFRWNRGGDVRLDFALLDYIRKIRTWRGFSVLLYDENVPESPVGISNCHGGLRLFGFLPSDPKFITDRGWLGLSLIHI